MDPEQELCAVKGGLCLQHVLVTPVSFFSFFCWEWERGDWFFTPAPPYFLYRLMTKSMLENLSLSQSVIHPVCTAGGMWSVAFKTVNVYETEVMASKLFLRAESEKADGMNERKTPWTPLGQTARSGVISA